MKKETLEKKKARKSLLIAFILTGVAALAVIACLIFWYNNEAFKTVRWGFTY
jgi:flagellar basal body-associated protein FliL